MGQSQPKMGGIRGLMKDNVTFLQGSGKEDRVEDKPCATPTSGTRQRAPSSLKTAHNEYASLNCNSDTDMPASDDMNTANGMATIMPRG